METQVSESELFSSGVATFLIGNNQKNPQQSRQFCCSVFFSKMYENNPLKIVDDKQSKQYKWLLKIVDLQQLIETKPAKLWIYATIIVKKQKEKVIAPIIQGKPDIQRIILL